MNRTAARAEKQHKTLSSTREVVSGITIDATPLMRTHRLFGKTIVFPFVEDQSVSRFLDNIFFWLNDPDGDVVAAFTYGRSWLLRNQRSHEVYDRIGSEYCQSRGAIEDDTTVREVGIKPGDTLIVIPVEPDFEGISPRSTTGV
jgi:hypothetical protein